MICLANCKTASSSRVLERQAVYLGILSHGRFVGTVRHESPKGGKKGQARLLGQPCVVCADDISSESPPIFSSTSSLSLPITFLIVLTSSVVTLVKPVLIARSGQARFVRLSTLSLTTLSATQSSTILSSTNLTRPLCRQAISQSRVFQFQHRLLSSIIHNLQSLFSDPILDNPTSIKPTLTGLTASRVTHFPVRRPATPRLSPSV
jgi:hypothetical protein